MRRIQPSPPSALTLELLNWVAERPRTHAETMAAWGTSCPRMSIWEDASSDGLVTVPADGGESNAARVRLTPLGRAASDRRPMTVSILNDYFDTLHTLRSWLIALCLTATLVSATPVVAQPAPGSTVRTASTSGVRDDDIAVLSAADAVFILGDVPTKVRLPVFNGIYRPLERFAGDLTGGTFGQQRVRSRDSLANGAIIGAVIGVATFGAFAAALCHAYQEEGSASCVLDTLRSAAIGGAIGAGAGLAIDAARTDRSVTVRIAIGF